MFLTTLQIGINGRGFNKNNKKLQSLVSLARNNPAPEMDLEN